MILALTAQEHRSLLAMLAHNPDAKLLKRVQIVLGLARHERPVHLARTLGCHRSTVYRVGHGFEATGLASLDDGRSCRRGARVPPSYLAALGALVKTSPREHGWARGTWSLELFGRELERQGFPRRHPATLARDLDLLGASWQRARPTLVSPDPDKAATLAALADLQATLPADERLFYGDEVDIHLNPKIGPQWAPRGCQPQVVTPGTNRKRYLAGALDVTTGDLATVEGSRKNSDLFIRLLTGLPGLFPDARVIHLVVDNYIIHKSKRTLAALAKLKGRVVLHFLPPYSPDHNPIEGLWKELHANVTRNHDAKDIDELMARVDAFLDDATPYPGNRPSLARAS